MQRILLIIIISLSVVACTRYPADVERALKLAGDNRAELERVLEHYHVRPGDSLKYRAACFLIANMPGKQSYYEKYYNKAGSELDFCGLKARSQERQTEIKDSINRLITLVKPFIRNDLEYITATFLIDNIDLAFEAWKYPWASHVPFDDFCKYILPYRCTTEPLTDNWRKKIHDKYHWMADSLKNINDPVEACVLINQDMMRWLDFAYLAVNYNLSYDEMLKYKTGDCVEMTNMATYLMRAMGIATTIDMVPYWRAYSLGHLWCCIRDTSGQFLPFDPLFKNPGDESVKKWRFVKAYRKEFAINWQSPHFKFPGVSLPSIFSQINLFDITDQYTSTCELRLPADSSNNNINYLAVFNISQWKVAAWGAVVNDTAIYAQLCNEIAYRPVTIDKFEVETLAPYPFVIDMNNHPRWLIPNYDERMEMQLSRFSLKDTLGHQILYDLYYFDHDWKHLCQTASCHGTISFSNVPKNALFLLKPVEKLYGLVRISPFTYENNKQVFR